MSITTVPDRLRFVHLALETLLNQSTQPDHIILWLGEELSSQIPARLKKLERRGVQIMFRPDIGVFTKEYYVLSEYPEAILVTADDDWMYNRGWLNKLYGSYLKAPDQIHCHGSRLMKLDERGQLTPHRSWLVDHGVRGPSHFIFPLTGQGVLIPPKVLHPDVLDVSLCLKLSPTNDDIWLKAMALLNRVRCTMVAPFSKSIWGIAGTQDANLYMVNRSRNDEYFQNVVEHYQLMEILRSEQDLQHG